MYASMKWAKTIKQAIFKLIMENKQEHPRAAENKQEGAELKVESKIVSWKPET